MLTRTCDKCNREMSKEVYKDHVFATNIGKGKDERLSYSIVSRVDNYDLCRECFKKIVAEDEYF